MENETETTTLFDLGPFKAYTEINDVSILSSASQNGDICEQQFCLDAKKRGYEVFMPMGHATKVDVAIKKASGNLVSVQVKKAYWSNQSKCYRISCGTKGNRKSRNTAHVPYTYGDFDILAGHIYDLDIWVFLDITTVSKAKQIYPWRPAVGKPENNWDIFDPYFSEP